MMKESKISGSLKNLPPKRKLSQLILISLFVPIWQSSVARADEPPYMLDSPTSVQVKTKSTWKVMRERIRMRTFSEFMTPAFKDNPNHVPDTDGSQLAPTNTFNIAWVDYEIANDFKVVYWQRFTVNLASTSKAEAIDAIARNPRFAIRKVNVFKVPNLTTTYDIYFQPGLASEATAAGRNFEFGFRTNTSYAFPGSRWTIGGLSETTFSISKQYDKGSNFYGWLMPWASYDLNKTFSTQHYITLNYEHGRGTSGLQWDTPMPYIQNGIGVAVTEVVWAGAFLNNYLGAAPSLANTWASLWLSLNVL